MRLHCAVTHIDEVTLEACLASIRRQSVYAHNITVVSGVSPANKAFNQAMDDARAADADLLVHLAADVILHRHAIRSLVRRFDPQRHYAVVARGFDIFNGENSPVGLWALNIRSIPQETRFHDTFKMDLEFCDRVEAETGLTRIKTKSGNQLGYHHPIWTSREMFHKFRYNAAKYAGKDIRKYRAFFDRALAVNPSNIALRAGQMGLNRGMSEPALSGAPNRTAYAEEWEDVADLLGATGREFFALHEDFVALGRHLLGPQPDLVAMEGPSFLSKKSVAEQGNTESRIMAAKALTGGIGHSVRDQAADRLRLVYDRLPARGQNLVRIMTGRPALPGTTAPGHNLWGIFARARPLARGAGTLSGIPGAAQVARSERTDWAARWDACPVSRRILMVAPKDFAGSMFKWAEAINRHTHYAARLVTFGQHQYGYPADVVLEDLPGPEEDRIERIAALAGQAGLLHLKDEHSWFLRSDSSRNAQLLERLFFSNEFASTPKAFTHYGGYARKLKRESEYVSKVSRFDLRIAMTPDLNFDWFAGDYIPHTIDVDRFRFEWQDTRVIAHSPSTREKKGTYLLEEALLILARDHKDVWNGWTADLIHGVVFDECMARKRRASLFFDQAGRHRAAALGIDDFVGWYGNSAIEAMAFGIPTIAHLADHAFAGADRAGVDLSDSPVINILPTREGLLAAILAFVRATPEARSDLAAATRRYTVNFHGYAAVGNRLAAVYDRVLPIDPYAPR